VSSAIVTLVMQKNDTKKPDAATVKNELATNDLVPRFGSKRDVAAMLQMSVRSVDNYVRNGCPCIKVSSRRLRFDLGEVREWFKQQYGEQRKAS
jgi:predicted DNA-binding transcriptional regulator AlpA